MLPQQHLTDALGWDPSEIQVVESLPGGPSSQRWHLARAGEHYMMRLDLPLAGELGLQRRTEASALKAAHAIGLAPATILCMPDAGVLLLEWVPGRVCSATDLEQPEVLQPLGRMMARLHREQATLPLLDVAAAMRHYAQQVGTSQALAWAEAGIERMPPSIATPRLCHNDLTAPNVIITSNQLQFLDWEYAALGDPLFDLAVPVAHHQLSAQARESLLQAWHEAADLPWTRAQASERLAQWMDVYQYLLILWLSAVATTTALNEDQNTQLQRAIARLA